MEAKLQRLKELIRIKEETDAELEALIGGGTAKVRKPQQCSACGSSEHSARTCPTKANGPQLQA